MYFQLVEGFPHKEVRVGSMPTITTNLRYTNMEKFKYIIFGPELILGIDSIDDQHKRIIQFYNKLVHSFNNDACDAHLVLDELVNYTKFHFTNEEKFLEKINYPQFEEHQKKHLAIIEDLMNLIMGLMNNGSNDEFKTKLLSFFQRLDYLPHYD